MFGRGAKDEDVLRVGHAIEQRTKVREGLKPYLEPKTELADVVVE